VPGFPETFSLEVSGNPVQVFGDGPQDLGRQVVRRHFVARRWAGTRVTRLVWEKNRPKINPNPFVRQN
jgi:hypothetical protein